MKSETVIWDNLVLRKEAIIGINLVKSIADVSDSSMTIQLYLISGQAINIDVEHDKSDAAYKRLKNLAAL